MNELDTIIMNSIEEHRKELIASGISPEEFFIVALGVKIRILERMFGCLR